MSHPLAIVCRLGETGTSGRTRGDELHFDELLSRADDLTLQELIGRPVVRLLRSIDPDLAAPSQLRAVISRLKTPQDLLTDPGTRKMLLELLPLDRASELAERLGLEGKDPFEALSEITTRKGSRREEALLAFFQLVRDDLVEHDTSPSSSEVEARYGLFAHQRKAARATAGALSSGNKRVLLHMPTGSGKTRTAMNTIVDHLRNNEPTLVTWLAYSEELCEQAATEFQEAWAALGNRRVDVYRWWGGHDLKLEHARDGFLVAGLAKAFSAAKKSIGFISTLADRNSLVIIDEAHQAVAPTYSLVLETLVTLKPGTGLLGLTATPGRTWAEIDVDAELANFFSKQKVTLEVEGFENPVEYLMSEGYLARPTFYSLLNNSGIDLSESDIKSLETQLDVPNAILKRLAEDEQRSLLILHKTEELLREHNRVLVFATTVEHARILAVVLNARGVDAQAVTGETPTGERARAISKYKSNTPEPMVLCNYGVLTTGFDAPTTSAAIIARPTKSLVLYMQMVGRATRGTRAGGNERAEIVTVIDQGLPGFGDIGEAFFNWEDVWQ